jgi:anti-sigma factor RsiW
MSCEQWRDQLDAYADDAPGNYAALEEHLRTCPACTSAVLGRIQLKRATRAAAAGRFTPSPAFRLKIDKSIAAKQQPRRFSAWIPSLAGALAALLVLAVSVGVWMRHQAREQAIAQLLDMHVATIASANPVDVVSTDRHTVKPWFQGKLPFTFNLPELANTPYKLLGGKLVYLHDQPAAQLLFELRKHQLTVFIAQEQGGSFPVSESDTRANGFTVETWTQDGLRYAIISDTNQNDVNELGNLLKTAAKQ